MGNLRLYALALLVVVVLHLCIPHAESASCCLKYSRKPFPCRKMKGYAIQDSLGHCNIDAIIFQTKGDRYICADPSQQWTMDRITCLKERAEDMNDTVVKSTWQGGI